MPSGLLTDGGRSLLTEGRKDENKTTIFIYMYTSIYAMSQIISISDDVYETLKRLKGKESYSVAIRGLLKSTSNKEKVLGLFGKGGVDETKVKELSPLWKKWSDEYV